MWGVGERCMWCFPSASVVKDQPAMQELQETYVQSLGREDPQEEEESNGQHLINPALD